MVSYRYVCFSFYGYNPHRINSFLNTSHQLDVGEVVLCIKTLNLEVSETTHERKPLVAVGTAIVRGEDLATKGCIYIFEVITVVPEPGRPETNRKLRLIVKEEVKGAVTTVSEIGSQGFMIMAQGQKCMVRGLKEDGTLLPVAFMDMQCYVTVLKELKGTGMVLMGDAFKGVWFTGYTVGSSFGGATLGWIHSLLTHNSRRSLTKWFSLAKVVHRWKSSPQTSYPTKNNSIS